MGCQGSAGASRERVERQGRGGASRESRDIKGAMGDIKGGCNITKMVNTSQHPRNHFKLSKTTVEVVSMRGNVISKCS